MITNSTITYYHKIFNKTTKLEEWEKNIFDNAWVFGNRGANINKGFENANEVNVRIPLKEVADTKIFSIGDIIAVGINEDIEKQADLEGKEFYNITNIKINTFGNNPHIHLGGR